MQRVTLNGNNFAKAASFRLENLPALTAFSADYNCFKQAELVFANDPMLKEIRLGTGAAQEGSLTLEAGETHGVE